MKFSRMETFYLWRYGLPGVLIVFLFFVVYAPVLRAEKSSVDEWRSTLIATTQPTHPQIAGLGQRHARFWNYALIDDFARSGRFRVMFWMLMALETRLATGNPWAWHLATLILGAGTCLLFYTALCRIGFHAGTAWVCSMWLAFAGEHIWLENMKLEKAGMFFVSFSLLAFVNGARAGGLNRWDWLGLLMLAFSALSKESFVLLIPAVLLLRVALGCCHFRNTSVREGVYELKPLLLTGSGLFIGLIVVLAIAYRQGRYGAGVVGETGLARLFAPNTWLFMLGLWNHRIGFYVPLLGLLLLPRTFLLSKQSVIWGAVFLSWLLPQLILYAESGLYRHYAFPALLAMITLCGGGLEILWRRSKLAYGTCMALSVLTLLISGILTTNAARFLVAQSRVENAVMRQTASALTNDAPVAVAPTYWEQGVSFLVALGEAGNISPAYLVLPDDVSDDQARLLEDTFLDAERLPVNDVTVIALFIPLAEFEANAPDWYAPDEWTVHEFHERYAVFDLYPAPGIHQESIDHAVLIRR